MAELREEHKIYCTNRKGYIKNGFYSIGKQYARIWTSIPKLKKLLEKHFLCQTPAWKKYKNGLKDIPDSWILCSYSTETGYKEMKVKDLFIEDSK